MLNGVKNSTIDDKGRLAIPAAFRDVLANLSSPVLCTTLKSRSHLLLYPEHSWQPIEAELLALPISGNEMLRHFQSLVLTNMERLTTDGSGRVQLSANLRGLVHLNKDVVVAGRSDRLEIWDRDEWYRQMDAILDIDPQALERELASTNLRI